MDETIPGTDRRARDYGAKFNRLKADLEIKKSALAAMNRKRAFAESELSVLQQECKRAATIVSEAELRVSNARRKTELSEQPLSWYFVRACENLCKEDGTMALYDMLRVDAERMKSDAIMAHEFKDGERPSRPSGILEES